MQPASGAGVGGKVVNEPLSPFSFRAWLNQTWIDLCPPHTDECLTPWGVELAFRSFVAGENLPRFNSIVPTIHRRDVKFVSSATNVVVAIKHPGEVPTGFRSERWSLLCEGVAIFDALETDAQDRLLWLLHRLCFHELVVDLSLKTSIKDHWSTFGSVNSTVAISRHCLLSDQGQDFYKPIFEALCCLVPKGSLSGVEATYHVLIQHAKRQPNLIKAREALQAYSEAVDLAVRQMRPFEAGLVMSRYYRVRAFIPMLEGDMSGMVADMDKAELVARQLKPSSEAEHYAAAEILWPVLESRVREAQVMEDFGQAERRARDLVSATPLNARAWLHLGETLLALERYTDAIPVYREAHRIGPPASPVALFNLGQCYEMLDEVEPAMDAYAELLALDPMAIGAAERLSSIAADYGGRYKSWAEAIFKDLSAMQAASSARIESSAVPARSR